MLIVDVSLGPFSILTSPCIVATVPSGDCKEGAI